jgi:hypothetical protein
MGKSINEIIAEQPVIMAALLVLRKLEANATDLDIWNAIMEVERIRPSFWDGHAVEPTDAEKIAIIRTNLANRDKSRSRSRSRSRLTGVAQPATGHQED